MLISPPPLLAKKCRNEPGRVLVHQPRRSGNCDFLEQFSAVTLKLLWPRQITTSSIVHTPHSIIYIFPSCSEAFSLSLNTTIHATGFATLSVAPFCFRHPLRPGLVGPATRLKRMTSPPAWPSHSPEMTCTMPPSRRTRGRLYRYGAMPEAFFCSLFLFSNFSP